MKPTLTDYCQAKGDDTLLREWNLEQNSGLDPAKLTIGSEKQIHWKCSQGHEWSAGLRSRVKGSGCPVCAGKVVVPGFNDLASALPALALQWAQDKNGSLTPRDVTAGSARRVWWRCPLGHIWKSEIYLRSEGNGCPYCANQIVLPGFNDLKTRFPLLAGEWDATKNGMLTAEEVTCASHKIIWWRCKTGHSWRAPVFDRTRGRGCPVCAGKVLIPGENDFAALYPDLAAEMLPPSANEITVRQIFPNSKKKVWWRCPLGHTYTAAPASRVQGTGCPYCAGRKVLPGFNDLATKEPRVAAQWHPTLNGGLAPNMVTAGCDKRIWWKCEDGHVWQAKVYDRAGKKKTGCPVCSGRVKQKNAFDLKRSPASHQKRSALRESLR